MSSDIRDGDVVHGEVDSADASGAGIAFKLYRDGGTTEYTLAQNERLFICSAAILNANAGTYSIVAATDSDGRRVLKAALAANSGVSRVMFPYHICPAGVTPKLIASIAGDVRGKIEGFVRKV